ncbi:MAG: hypothetical protein H0T92_19090 [Pyrinomonadaceae bacterium]|nr:hypothetical protein [Pyrinomonadaceae bacterium]
MSASTPLIALLAGHAVLLSPRVLYVLDRAGRNCAPIIGARERTECEPISKTILNETTPGSLR